MKNLPMRCIAFLAVITDVTVSFAQGGTGSQQPEGFQEWPFTAISAVLLLIIVALILTQVTKTQAPNEERASEARRNLQEHVAVMPQKLEAAEKHLREITDEHNQYLARRRLKRARSAFGTLQSMMEDRLSDPLTMWAMLQEAMTDCDYAANMPVEAVSEEATDTL